MYNASLENIISPQPLRLDRVPIVFKARKKFKQLSTYFGSLIKKLEKGADDQLMLIEYVTLNNKLSVDRFISQKSNSKINCLLNVLYPWIKVLISGKKKLLYSFL